MNREDAGSRGRGGPGSHRPAFDVQRPIPRVQGDDFAEEDDYVEEEEEEEYEDGQDDDEYAGDDGDEYVEEEEEDGEEYREEEDYMEDEEYEASGSVAQRTAAGAANAGKRKRSTSVSDGAVVAARAPRAAAVAARQKTQRDVYAQGDQDDGVVEREEEEEEEYVGEGNGDVDDEDEASNEESDAGDDEEEDAIEYADEDEDEDDGFGGDLATAAKPSLRAVHRTTPSLPPFSQQVRHPHAPITTTAAAAAAAVAGYPPPRSAAVMTPSFGPAATGGGGGGLKLKLRMPSPALPSSAAGSGAFGNGGGGGASYRPGTATPPVGGGHGYGYVYGAGGGYTEDEGGYGGEGDEGEDDWDEERDAAAEAREEALKRRKRLPAVLLTEEELASMDDEVEKVLSHRDIPGLATDPVDPWKTREFYVKWARHSYIHCSWDSYTTLAQLAGFKRVLNYCRKMDGEAVERAAMGVDEREEADVRAELEAELERGHTLVDRVLAMRTVPAAIPTEEAEQNFEQSILLAGAAGKEASAESTKVQYLCKWQGLPYSEATWEDAADVQRVGGEEHVRAFETREARAMEPCQSVARARLAFSESVQRAFTEQPEYLTGGELRDYQLASLNWMAYNWARGVNGILADEMGLGKTVQCAAFAGYLSHVAHVGAPILIVVPLSTVPNWAREFCKWVPTVNTVVYVGDAASRQVIRRFEFPPHGAVEVDKNPLFGTNGFNNGSVVGLQQAGAVAAAAEAAAAATAAGGRTFKVDAIITTYELVLKDAALLRDVKWAQLMVDEAHRLKNDDSALYKELSQWSFDSKLLVTGTPLQNNLRELWALLAFLHPDKFPSPENFEAQHDTKDPAGVQRLHATLRPHLLRRVIKDVEKSLPPKNERILRVPMTPLQKQYYRWILTRNFKELNRSARKAQVTLLNIISDLKKCCNHPFLFESARENYKVPPGIAAADDVAASLVLPSGKMVLLDKLLRRLKATGHRVLIFSQMVRVLDIVAEYMIARGYKHQRLDGSTPAHQRHQAMERFNAPGSEDFAFLLSTRAGGLGINLATADTVLLFDSDWNPQNDLQAMSRAHRIGQKDIVNIYRLVTSGSVEEDILERAKRKMVLDHVVIQRMDTSGRTVLDPAANSTTAGARLFGKDELAAILKFGAEELFKDGEKAPHGGEGAEDGGAAASDAAVAVDAAAAAAGGGMMTDADLDAILERAEVVEQREDTAPGGASDLLSSFNVATFKNDEDDAAFWSRLIPEDRRPKEESAMAAVNVDPGIRSTRLRALEASFGSGITRGDHGKGGKRGGGGRRGDGAEPGPKIDGALLRIDKWPQAVDREGRLVAGDNAPRPSTFPKTLGKRDATAFVKAVKRHGLVSKIASIVRDAGGSLSDATPEALAALWHGLVRGCEKVADAHAMRTAVKTPGLATSAASGGEGPPVSHHHHPPHAHGGGGHKAPPEGRLDFFGVEVRASELLAFVRQMALLESKASTSIGPDGRLRLTMAERPAPTAWMRASGWTQEDDAALLLGALRHGIGVWDRIADDHDLRLETKLAAAAGRAQASPDLPKSSHLETRVLGLLRQIEKVHRKASTKTSLPPQRPPSRPRPPPPHQRSAAEHERVKAALNKAETTLGEDAMTLVRKLRTLQRRGADMDTTLVVNKTRKYMASIGACIDRVAGEPAARAELWTFVSEFTENAMTGAQLENVYRRLQQGELNHADGVGAVTGGGSGVQHAVEVETL